MRGTLLWVCGEGKGVNIKDCNGRGVRRMQGQGRMSAQQATA